MIAALLGLDVIVAEAGLLTWALIRRPRADEPVFSSTYDVDAEAKTVILPAIDLDGVDRVRPYVKYAPPWIEPSADLAPALRRDLIRGYSVAQMLAANRLLAIEGGVG